MPHHDLQTTFASSELDVSHMTELHIPDFAIQSFRGIKDLKLPNLSRVTLLAGMNSVGKTSVLDAIRVWAARGRPFALLDILDKREEVFATPNPEGGTLIFYDWNSLTYNADYPTEKFVAPSIGVGPLSPDGQVTINTVFLTDDEANNLDAFDSSLFLMSEGQIKASQVNVDDSSYLIPWTTSAVEFEWDPYRSLRGRPTYSRLLRALNQKEWPPQINCASVGPDVVDNRDLSTIWDDVHLTKYEDLAIQALNLVLGESNAERIALKGDYSISSPVGRRFVVKVKGQDPPVPLKRFGEGAVRLFGMALTLASSKNSILLIDEVENGVHHSVQYDLWKMILTSSHANNTQVIATTHSWDCVKGFAKAAVEDDDVEGSCIRLERDGDALYAVEYTESELETVVNYGIEVR